MVIVARRRPRQRGLTLIEVLIALLIATVGLLGALAMLSTLMRGSAFSRNVSEASALVQSKIEEAQSLAGVSVAPPVPANGAITESGLNAFGQVAGGGMFSRVTTWGVSADAQRRTIQVTVSWADAGNQPHALSATAERIP